MFEQRREADEFVLGNYLLDEREQVSFLASNVLLELGAEGVSGVQTELVVEVLGEAADTDVIDQHPRNEWLVGVGKLSKRGEKGLLFLAEVMFALGPPVVEESSASRM